MAKYGVSFSEDEKAQLLAWKEAGRKHLDDFVQRVKDTQEKGTPRSAASVFYNWHRALPVFDARYPVAVFKHWPLYASDCKYAFVLFRPERMQHAYSVGFTDINSAEGPFKHEAWFKSVSGKHQSRKHGKRKAHGWLDTNLTKRSIARYEEQLVARRAFCAEFMNACSRELKLEGLQQLTGWACFAPKDTDDVNESGFVPIGQECRPKGVYLYDLRSKTYIKNTDFAEFSWGWRYASFELTADQLQEAAVHVPATEEQEKADYYSAQALTELAEKLGTQLNTNTHGWVTLQWQGVYGKLIVGRVVEGKTHFKNEAEVLKLLEKELTTTINETRGKLDTLAKSNQRDISLLNRVRSMG